jgi:hypothetical protein
MIIYPNLYITYVHTYYIYMQGGTPVITWFVIPIS